MKITKTDPNNPDTDGDGLPDGYELLTLVSDPLVSDSDQDEDEDGLSNLEEYQLGSDPTSADSDNDTLSDYDEVKKYKTNSTKRDTDGDKLFDGDEILFGFDPLKPDTDGNGIIDSEEKIEQTFTQEFDKEESKIIRKIIIQGKCSQNINYTTDVENYYNVDIQTTDVEGLVGIPVNIETKSKFDELNVTFQYDSLPKGVQEENLGVLWYNEKDDSYELQNSTIDPSSHMVSFSATHFSTYMLIDKKQWEKVWNTQIDYGNTKDAKEFTNIAYVVDYTQSMSNGKLPEIRTILKEFIGEMSAVEKGCVIGYKLQTADILAELSKNKTTLLNAVEQLKIDTKSSSRSAVTNLGIEKAITQLSKDTSDNGKMIILVGDTDITYSDVLVKAANNKKIRLFVLNVNPKVSLTNLKNMANKTNGFYYELSNLDLALNIFHEMKYVTLCGINTSDKDDDGLFDVYETKGMRICNGKLITTDPNLADTDGDGVTDSEELGYVFWHKITVKNTRGTLIPRDNFYFKLKTYPSLTDSDLDGIPDYAIGKTGDSLPKSNKQTGYVQNYKKGKLEYSYLLDYEFDYRWFQANNTRLNRKLQNASSIFATMAYYNSKDSKAEQYKMADEKDKSPKTIIGLMKKYGFTKVKECYLGDKYTDNHVVQFNLGQKELYNNVSSNKDQPPYHVVPIFIRGTKGQKEWFSNFDIGNSNDVGQFSDWTTANHHKGFDIAANRVVAETKAYLKTNNLNTGNTVLWITGHSRGGAVANLVAKKMEDIGYDTYTYTFATPNVTTDSMAPSKYKSIFNLVNEDDLIPNMPLTDWGFEKYGETRVVDMNENMITTFKDRISKEYSGATVKDLNSILGEFSKVIEKRNECNQYTCACHSKEGYQQGESIMHYVNTFSDRKKAEDYIAKHIGKMIPEYKENCKSSIVEIKRRNKLYYDYYTCQNPNYFMNLLAIAMASDFLEQIQFGLNNIPKKYENAKWELVKNVKKIKHPHYSDSYIILSK